MNATVEFLETSVSTQTNSFVNYLRITTQANYLISALNTNAVIQFYNYDGTNYFTGYQTYYVGYGDSSLFPEELFCGSVNPSSVAIFDIVANDTTFFSHMYWSLPSPDTAMVSGFFVGCTPLQNLLRSTLDCLYDSKCIEILIQYFPALSQVCVTLSYVFFCKFFLPRYN